MDVTGNGYNLSTFNAESEVIHLLEIQLDIQIQIIQWMKHLCYLGKILSQHHQKLSLLKKISQLITVVFSISKFYLTTNLVLFTSNDLSDLSSMSLNILYDFFFFVHNVGQVINVK